MGTRIFEGRFTGKVAVLDGSGESFEALKARRTKPAYCGLTRRRGTASWFSSTSQRSLCLRTITSGTT